MPENENIKARLMDARDIERALTRIAHEIVEKNRGVKDLCILGVRNRGEVLAERLGVKIRAIEGADLPVGALDITFYRDDTATRKTAKLPQETHIPFAIDGKIIVLVDDVLFTGRSARAAIDEIIDFGRPTAIQLAVLVDRGHREFPIHADYVGKNVPSSHKEQVLVRVKEYDKVDEVVIMENE